MERERVETHLDQYDLKQLRRWVRDGRFQNLEQALEYAVHTAVNQWRYDEFVKEQEERHARIDEKEFQAAVAAEGGSRAIKPASPHGKRVVIADADQYLDGLDDISPEDLVGPADEWLEVYRQR